MGRGSYLGGSTIITPGRGGWGSTNSSTSNKKKKQKNKKKDPPEVRAKKHADRVARDAERKQRAYEKNLGDYAFACGIASFKGKPFPSIPKKLKSYANNDEALFFETVQSHPKFALDEMAKAEIVEKNRSQINGLLRSFIKKCAKNRLVEQPIPEVPKCLINFLGKSEIENLLVNIETNKIFAGELKKLENQKRRAEVYRQKQEEKMAKIIVEKKPIRHIFPKQTS